MKPLNIKIIRNFLITAGFYGIYYAVIQFVALIWRRSIVQDRVFSGDFGQFLMWFAWEIPFWLYCLAAGYFLTFVVESERKYTWAIVLGSIFVINNILFTSVYYAEAPDFFDITTRCINIVSGLLFCTLGAFFHQKYKRPKPEQGLAADA